MFEFPLPTLLSLALSLLLILIPTSTSIPVSSHTKRQDATFDYVIVGGGTAGLTIANRLSEDPDVQVAVIEAGTFYQISNPVFSSTPAGCVLYAGASPFDTNPLVDWNFVTTPQAGANERRLHYARGKCLGGSSARNFMIYQRGDRGSYQRWADLVGDDSYTFDNWLPYFKKSTAFAPPASPPRAANASAEYVDSAFSPPGSPLQISYANYACPFSSWMERGLSAIGIPQATDFNSGSLNGSQYCSSTINPDDETRESSQTAYYGAEAQSRPNLKVYTLTLAKQIIFSSSSSSSKKATGVLISTNAILSARREVILSAGAFQSPQLLMVSGIGPAATLQKLGIEVIADRPGVGQGMQDHIFFGPSYRVKVDTLTRLANDPVYLAEQFATDYTLLKRGVFTNPVADYLGWELAPRDLITSSAAAVLSNSSENGYPQSWPDIEYISAPGYIGSFQNLLLQQPKDGFQYATILGAIVKPISRGNVTIESPDTSILPVINPNWLTDPTDQSVALAIYARIRAAFSSSAMAPVLADPVEYFPGPHVQTDEQILDTIRDSLHTVWHASCTCRMGKVEDVDAVVDSKARVIGVQGLRVVDASSFALLPPGHPQSTVYALAEKIAQGIKDGD